MSEDSSVVVIISASGPTGAARKRRKSLGVEKRAERDPARAEVVRVVYRPDQVFERNCVDLTSPLHHQPAG